MKLSKQTITILRNFASINQNIHIAPGSVMMTAAPNKTSFAIATVQESFPCDFYIYDLNELLGILSIFSEPELEFTERVLNISEGKNRIRYMPADAEVLIFPKKEPKFTDSPDAEFKLTAQQLTQIIKAASVLKVPVVTIRADGSQIILMVHDKSNPNSNQFVIDVDVATNREFELHIKIDKLNMIPEDYQVLVSNMKICKFVGQDKSYLVTGENDSTFN